MTSLTVQSEGLQALNSVWLDETSLEGGGEDCGAPALLSWQPLDGEEPLVGADFAAEVESVSRLFPHLDGLPAELTGAGAPGVAEQAAVCGGTSVALGAGLADVGPGSPADRLPRSPEDQCLMSPSDALLASPDPSLAPSPAGVEPGAAALRKHRPDARGQLGEAAFACGEKIATLIDFVSPACGPTARPPPAHYGDGAGVSEMETAPSPIAETVLSATTATETKTETEPVLLQLSSQPAVEPATLATSPIIEFAQSPLADLVSAQRAVEEDEHTRMIDQALEDLKTLESMCGISTDGGEVAAAGGTQEPSSTAAAAPVTAPADAVVKQEPAAQEEIEIVEERLAPRRRRRRPPRVAVTPAAAPAAPTQIVIVLTGEQLAGIQQSGQIVLNAAALQPALAAGGAAASAAAPAAKRRAVPSTAAGRRSGVKSETVARSAGSGSSAAGGVQTVIRPAGRKPQTAVRLQRGVKRTQKSGGQPASSKDPLSGWLEQKMPPSAAWDYPLLPAPALEQEAQDAVIPDDLQDVLLDDSPAGAVPSLPADATDCLLEELISSSVRENPGLFDGVGAADGADGSCAAPEAVVPPPPPPPPPATLPLPLLQGAGAASPPSVLVTPPPVGYSLSPAPQQQQQQLTLESWVPTLCPSPGEEPVSPLSDCSLDLAPAPDWSPAPAASRSGRRPRPYDKPAGRTAGRRQPLTEEERRERKKEQNKNAATRYRQKKKEEHDMVSEDQEKLEARNKQLRERVGALSRELNYLKQLMREVLRHKRVGV